MSQLKRSFCCTFHWSRKVCLKILNQYCRQASCTHRAVCIRKPYTYFGQPCPRVQMDVVRNLNVRDIISATPVLTKCPYCLSMVTWKDHKDNCRKKSLADGVPDHKVTTKNLAIKIRNHKTGNISGIGKCNV